LIFGRILFRCLSRFFWEWPENDLLELDQPARHLRRLVQGNLFVELLFVEVAEFFEFFSDVIRDIPSTIIAE
jgi:hypothetical protein